MNRVLAAAALAAGVGLVAGQAHADAAAGERLARQWCAECHIVGTGQTRGADVGPPFPRIAADKGWTEGALRAWLTDPHDPMPAMTLKTRDIESIVDYLETLWSADL